MGAGVRHSGSSEGAVARQDGRVLLRAVGDVALIGSAADALAAGGGDAWRDAASFLGAADVTFANFEMPLVRSRKLCSIDSTSPIYDSACDLTLSSVACAPGTDPLTSQALRRNLAANVDTFKQVASLCGYIETTENIHAGGLA